jgi:site-specific recombinase XerD
MGSKRAILRARGMAAKGRLVGWIDVRYSKRKGLWQARVRWRPDGRREVTAATFWHKNRAQARKLAADAQLELSVRARDALLEPSDRERRERTSETTLSTYFVEVYAPGRLEELAPNTARSYTETFRAWIAPYLGGYALAEIDKALGRTWVEWMREQGASYAVQKKALAVARAVVTDARKRDYLDSSPSHPLQLVEAKSPRATRRVSLRALSFVEVERIAARISSASDRLFLRLIAEAGLRGQEVIPLLWEDALDSNGRPRATLRIERAVSGRGRRREIRSPKTQSGYRRVKLFAPLGEDISELWASRGRPPLRTPIFPARRASSSDGLIDAKRWAQRVFYPALSEAGIPRVSEEFGRITPHRLRAACASALGYAGWSLAEVQAHIGHSPGSARTLLEHYFFAFDESHAELRGLAPEEQIVLAREKAAAELTGRRGRRSRASARARPTAPAGRRRRVRSE